MLRPPAGRRRRRRRPSLPPPRTTRFGFLWVLVLLFAVLVPHVLAQAPDSSVSGDGSDGDGSAGDGSDQVPDDGSGGSPDTDSGETGGAGEGTAPPTPTVSSDSPVSSASSVSGSVPASASASASASVSASASSALSSSSASRVSTSPTPLRTAYVGAPTLKVTDLNSNFTLTLNRTHPVFVLDFPETPNVAAIFNLATALANDSITDMPRILVAKDEPYDFVTGRGARQDGTNGGTRDYPNHFNSRTGAWRVQWDNGFANWTWGYDPNNLIFEANATAITPRILVGRGVGDDVLLNTSRIGPANLYVWVGLANNVENQVVSGIAPSTALLGDTTDTSVLFLSPLLLHAPLPQPQYPNYTFPQADFTHELWTDVQQTADATNMSYSDTTYFGAFPNLSYAILPTDSAPIRNGLGNSMVAIARAAARLNSTNTTLGGAGEDTMYMTNVNWTRINDEEGYRAWAVHSSLQPNTNYTLWIISDSNGVISRPMYFRTKEAGFPCPLVAPTTLCPNVAYASPIAPATVPLVWELPPVYADIVTSNLQAFEVSLMGINTACGRDAYSHRSSCHDCHMAYRDWLCRTVLPQCASSAPPAFENTTVSAPQAPFTVPRTVAAPRNQVLSYDYDYTELLPCISTCTAVDRQCPAQLQFYCPHRNFNANESYAYLTRDNMRHDGTHRHGWPALDVWGNRWCNG